MLPSSTFVCDSSNGAGDDEAMTVNSVVTKDAVLTINLIEIETSCGSLSLNNISSS